MPIAMNNVYGIYTSRITYQSSSLDSYNALSLLALPSTINLSSTRFRLITAKNANATDYYTLLIGS